VALPRVVNAQTQQEIQNELNSRWGRVLAVPPGERRVAYRSEDLLPLVQREFAAPGPGWQKARYHSPDLLIAAPSLEAFRQGDYQAVLGEIHVAVNSLDRFAFFSQHPHPEELRAAIESDLPEPSLIPVFTKVWNHDTSTASLGLWAPSVSSRMNVALRSDKDFYLDVSLDAPGLSSSQLLPIGDLVVEPGGSGLVVRPRDGRVSFDILDFYQLVMMMQVLTAYRILPSSTYTPRITVDRLVVVRESWHVPLSELEFARASTADERFAAARRWARGRDLPRFLFAKTPGEVKPFYVDLESPVLVENLAKAIRRAGKSSQEDATVLFSEMLPGHDQVWLPDAQGNRYTCELRMVVLDLESRPALAVG
jgi:Lantibiotic dehydratase, N terminus